ncbi:FAD-dependent oxidoreductase [Pseudonocardia sp. RS11V-5]|uniref:NAD(P)/FAD-dependent oxidoreductase n=1 Tax=Pseudonocardia terrae TaxID=2905831 RepID=UPI001E62D3AC|nr:FAD-dependent oxidoreductase [Pseudonocardia terrae]MCE3555888.1 FAD-dependent oxidoreductase [Pseudonocardia terrae]
MSVVVVGAGLSGVACARQVARTGLPVKVLDRAHTVGGRMASSPHDGRPVDMGAAYFTVRDPEFAEVVAGWRSAGLARPWTAEMAVLAHGNRSRSAGPMRWAAPKGLRSLVAALAEDLDVELDHEVKRVEEGPRVDGELVDVVVLAMPDPQALRVLAPGLGAVALTSDRPWRPVLTVAAGYPTREWPELSAAFVNDHPVLTLVADDGARRGDGVPVLVAHTTSEVARTYDADPAGAVPAVVGAVRELLGLTEEPVWTDARRWRFAAPELDRAEPFHLGDDGIGLAGDGWGSSRIETAWRSGTLLGREIVKRLQR